MTDPCQLDLTAAEAKLLDKAYTKGSDGLPRKDMGKVDVQQLRVRGLLTYKGAPTKNGEALARRRLAAGLANPPRRDSLPMPRGQIRALIKGREDEIAANIADAYAWLLEHGERTSRSERFRVITDAGDGWTLYVYRTWGAVEKAHYNLGVQITPAPTDDAPAPAPNESKSREGHSPGSPDALGNQAAVKPGLAGGLPSRNCGECQGSSDAPGVEAPSTDAPATEAPSLELFKQTPRPYQWSAIEDATYFCDACDDLDDAVIDESRRIMYSAPTGCHARGENVLHHTGRRIAAENVRVGDMLAGVDGPRRVLRLHRGRQEMARVTPTKGDPFVVNLDHVLTLIRTNDGSRKAGELVDVTVREWLTWSKTAKHVHKLLRVPGSWGHSTPHDYAIHPWLLGVLLGDGCLTAGTPVIANSDPDVAAEVERLASRHAVGFERVDVGGKFRLRLNNGMGGGAPNPLLTGLRDMNLHGCTAGEKFVPARYLHNGTTETRLEVLAGLLDTDGHLERCGYDFISKSGRLADDCARLARSVGLAAYVSASEKFCQNGTGGTYYRVSISGDCDKIPCRVKRKQAPKRRQIKDVLRTGFTVELLPEDDYFGWEVDGDHRYLLADHTLTHNSGKGSMALSLLKHLRTGRGADATAHRPRDAWILTPSLEVIRGFLERTGVDAATLREASAETLAKLAARIYVTTPVRLDNYLRNPRPDSPLAPYVTGVPDVIIYDEAHHAIESNSTSGNLFAMAPHATWIGLTATPFRGTPRGTQELERVWREIVEVLSIPDAVRLGAWALPTFEVVGLVDDDRIKLSGGDFQAKAAGKAVASRIEDLATLTRKRFVGSDPLVFDGGDALDPHHRIPTAVTVPNREAAGLLVEALDRLGVDAIKVDANTKARDRAAAYDTCREGRAVLVSVRVISEGVDLPWLRRLIDARPTMSPVSFVQQLGRITRPGDVRPEYICVCRNLERHAYLLGGCVPPQQVKQAQEAFDKPSKRDSLRSVGLEQLSRHKPIMLHLADGLKGRMFSVYTIDEQTGAKTCYAALQHPSFAAPIYAARTDKRLVASDEAAGDAKGTKATHVWDFGKWRRVDSLPDVLEGWATSSARGKATERQREAWRRMAARVGLDPEAADLDKLTKREVEPLFVLSNTKTSMQPAYLRAVQNGDA